MNGTAQVACRSAVAVAWIAAAMAVAGCSTQPVPDEPITFSQEWFQCDSRFDCVAVFDDYCKYTGVNARYSLVYQDWVRQQVTKSGELRPCQRDRDENVLTAYCRNQRCEYP